MYLGQAKLRRAENPDTKSVRGRLIALTQNKFGTGMVTLSSSRTRDPFLFLFHLPQNVGPSLNTTSSPRMAAASPAIMSKFRDRKQENERRVKQSLPLSGSVFLYGAFLEASRPPLFPGKTGKCCLLARCIVGCREIEVHCKGKEDGCGLGKQQPLPWPGTHEVPHV